MTVLDFLRDRDLQAAVYARFVRAATRPTWTPCCPQATVVRPHPCVCAEVHECPEHGRRCHGSHE